VTSIADTELLERRVSKQGKPQWSPADQVGPRFRLAFALAFVFLGALVRIRFASLPNSNSQDLARCLLNGKAVLQKGLSAAGQPLAETFPDAEKAGVPWTHIPFNYPPMAVALFTFIAAVGGGPLFAKMLLTAFDGISSALMFRLTRRRWIALGYWISPVSIWWTSHEGQFEALQTMFGLGALATVNSPVACGLLLACAIQSKVTAAALGPFLLWKMYRNQTVQKFLLGGLIGMVPTVVAQSTYPMLQNIRKYSSQFTWNPFYWNPVAKGQTWSRGVWFGRTIPQLLSWTLIICVLVISTKRRNFLAATPALAYFVVMKLYTQFPGWYWNTLALVMFPLFLPAVNSASKIGKALKRDWARTAERTIWAVLAVGETTGLSAFALWWLL
jgi:hypothetical protein